MMNIVNELKDIKGYALSKIEGLLLSLSNEMQDKEDIKDTCEELLYLLEQNEKFHCSFEIIDFNDEAYYESNRLMRRELEKFNNAERAFLKHYLELVQAEFIDEDECDGVTDYKKIKLIFELINKALVKGIKNKAIKAIDINVVGNCINNFQISYFNQEASYSLSQTTLIIIASNWKK